MSLSDVAGVDIAAELVAVSTEAVGYRGRILGDRSGCRNHSAVVFPRDSAKVPVLAYVLTRVVPLARAVGVLE